MEQYIFIISVYCLVADTMQIIEKTYKFRSRGFPPKLTDAEVITMEICGEFFKLHEDTEIYKYFKRHYFDFFPNLPDRTNFVRQAANLWQVKLLIQMIITESSDQHAMLCNRLTLCRCRFAPIHAAVFGINAFHSSRSSGIVPPRNWIITASNSA